MSPGSVVSLYESVKKSLMVTEVGVEQSTRMQKVEKD